MKAYEHKQMTVAELIEHLQSSFSPDRLIVADLWMSEDIRSSGEHLEKLTDEQCRVVMAHIDETCSTENGINHDTINRAVDECIDLGLIKYSYPEF